MKNLITYFSNFAPDNGSGMHRLWTDNGPMKSRKLFALLFTLLFIGVGNTWGETLFSFTGTSSGNYSIPNTWTASNVTGDSYFLFNTNGCTLTSPLYDPHDNVSLTFSVATYGSTTNHNLTVRVLNSSNAVQATYTTDTPTSTTYVSTNSPIDLGDIGYSFKIQFYLASANKGVRLRNTTLTGDTHVSEPYTVKFYKTDGTFTSITEASAGAGVTPPTMNTPCDGWAFQGWSKTESDDDENTDELALVTLTAGKYYPTANTTLYPVYTKAGSASFDVEVVPGTFSSLGSSNYGSGAERTGSVGGVSFGGHYITGNATNSPASGKTAGTYLQCQASNANIYNKTAFSGPITKVVLKQYAAQAFTLYCGSSQLMASNNTSTGQTPSGTAQTAQTAATTMTWNVSEASNYTYFDIKKGSGTGYITSITITYNGAVTYYYSYPNCCTNLGSINGSFLWTAHFIARKPFCRACLAAL